MEKRRSIAVQGDQEEMWRYGNGALLSSQQRITNRTRERTSNVAPLSMQRPFRMPGQKNKKLFKHTVSLTQLPS